MNTVEVLWNCGLRTITWTFILASLALVTLCCASSACADNEDSRMAWRAR